MVYGDKKESQEDQELRYSHQVWHWETFWREQLQIIKYQDESYLNTIRMCCTIKEETNRLLSLSQKKKIDMMNKTSRTILMYLGDKVFRQVIRERTIVAMWMKLESLYTMKSLAHRLYLKKKK